MVSIKPNGFVSAAGSELSVFPILVKLLDRKILSRCSACSLAKALTFVGWQERLSAVLAISCVAMAAKERRNIHAWAHP
jgi:hypothetical protein